MYAMASGRDFSVSEAVCSLQQGVAGAEERGGMEDLE